jgi:hypothetical protein
LRGVTSLNQVSQEQQLIRQYLLGLAAPEDSLLVEEQLLLAGDAFYQELLIAEDELVDEYLSDHLTEFERQRFETHFLQAPERRQKLGFARALRRYVDLAGTSRQPEANASSLSPEVPSVPHPPPAKFLSFLHSRNPVVPYALVAATALIVGGFSWVLLNNWRQQKTRPTGEVLAVVLTPGRTRDSGETKRVAISPDTGIVRLQLAVANADYLSYRALVLSSDLTEVWNQTELTAREQSGLKVVTADLPANSLSPGDYQIKLSGQLRDGASEDIATYQLRITR